MFIPNNTCMIRRAAAGYDSRGERSYAPPMRIPCAIVSLNLEVEKTSVRADSSGSRGRAEETQGTARILFPKYIQIGKLDIIEADGEILEVIQVNKRRNVLGILDHIEVDLRQSELP